MGVMISNKQCGCRALSYDDGTEEKEFCTQHRETAQDSELRRIRNWIAEDLSHNGPPFDQIVAALIAGDCTNIQNADEEHYEQEVTVTVTYHTSLRQEELDFLRNSKE